MSPRTLSLVAVTRVDFPLFRAAATAATALLDLPVPARWTWTVEAGGGRDPRATLAVSSLDDAMTAEAADAARAALASTVPWLGWSAAVPPPDDRPASLLSFTADLVAAPPADNDAADRDGEEELTHGPDLLLPFWSGVHGGSAPVRLTVTLGVPAIPRPRPAAAIGVVSLSSDSVAVLAQAGVLAAALSRTPGELTAVHRRSTPGTVTVTPTRLGRCLAAVCLLPSGWPSRPPTAPAEVVERLAAVVPPHTALFGGSGLGKTTLLEALVEHRMTAGRTTVVIDPHGDLAARAAVAAAALERPATCVDFGDVEQPPLWNLAQPPAGIEPRAWATDLLGALQAAWPDADEQWFGPVYRRTMFSLLLPLVLDPAGPWPLTRLPDLAAPEAARPDARANWRRQLLARIGDPAVTRDLWEAVRMLDGDRDRHARTWLLSKLEPLLQHPGMRRVIDAPVSSVDLDDILRGRSLIVSAPAATLGDEGATVICMLAMRWIWHRVRRQGSPPGGLDIVLDEAHRMPAALCQEILAEGRKYGLQLRLATQSPALLAPALRTAVLTNAGSVAALRLGPEDAVSVRSRFPDVAVDELCRLPARQVAIASAEGPSAIGSGPAGRPLEEGAALRAAHRATTGQARTQLIRRLQRDLEQRLAILGRPGRHAGSADDEDGGPSELERWLGRRPGGPQPRP